MVRRLTAALGVIAVVALVSGCRAQEGAAPSPEWDAFAADFEAAYMEANPQFAVSQGRHEFDGRLPDWSAEAIKGWIASLRALRDKAEAFDEESLDPRQAFDREHLLAVIDGELFWRATAQWPFRNPAFYAFALDPNVYVTREYAPPARRLAAYTAYAKQIPGAVAQIKANLRTPLPRPYLDIGVLTFGGLADYYANDVPEVFTPVTDSALQAEFQAAIDGAVTAMRDIVAFLEEQRPRATDDFALGADLFSAMLRATERVDIPLDELERVGRLDLARNVDALRQACGAHAPGKSIPDCVAQSTANKPEGGTVAAAGRQLDDLRSFILEKNIVTIPGPETGSGRRVAALSALQPRVYRHAGPLRGGPAVDLLRGAAQSRLVP